MKSKISLLIVLVVLISQLLYSLILCSCSSGIPPKILDNKKIQGEWTDFKGIAILGGDIINIQFKTDSFYYWNHRFSDVFLSRDSCQKEFGSEYASGFYEIENDLIHLYGNWTDKMYKKIKTSGCFNNGEFDLTYKCTFFSVDSLKFELEEPSQIFKYYTGVKSKLKLFKK